MKTVIMPKLGFTQTESTIVTWLKHEGDAVVQGEPIAEVTTDKVNMEVEAPESGTLAGIKFKEGDTVPVTETIAFILKQGERLAEEGEKGRKGEGEKAVPPLSASVANATPIAARIAAEMGVDLSAIKGTGAGGKITREDVEKAGQRPPPRAADGAPSPVGTGEGTSVRATPAARRLAEENAIALASVNGSGPNGRVQGGDVLTAIQDKGTRRQGDKEMFPPSPPPLVPPSLPAQTKAISYTGMRKTIGTRLQQSYQQVPHITLDVDVDVSAAEALRARANAKLKEGHTKISLTAMIVKACAWALQRHPLVNSRLDEAAGQIVLLDEVNIGIAVALSPSTGSGGLIVPVVRNVQAKGVQQIANELADLGARAKANKLKQDEISGGTFTISNLGMYGVDRFTAIINPPETAILAVGRSKMAFVPDASGQPVAKPMMTIRLSADHRVIDGAVAAQFLGDVRAAIEEPGMMAL